MNSFELTEIITALANSIAYGKTNSELAILSAVFVQLGDTLATIITAREFCENKKE